MTIFQCCPVSILQCKQGGVSGTVTKCEGHWRCMGTMGSHPALGQWSYLECGHGCVPAIPVYGVELGRVVELMVQLRMSFASVHHFLEGKTGRDSKNEPNRTPPKKK